MTHAIHIALLGTSTGVKLLLQLLFIAGVVWALRAQLEGANDLRRTMRRFERAERKEIRRAVLEGRAVNDPRLAAAAVSQAEWLERYASARIGLRALLVFALYFAAGQILDYRPSLVLVNVLFLAALLALWYWGGRRRLPRVLASKRANQELLTPA